MSVPEWPTGSSATATRWCASPATPAATSPIAEAVAKAVAGVDAIAHLVAILDGSDEQFQAVNVGGTRNCWMPPARPVSSGSCT